MNYRCSFKHIDFLKHSKSFTGQNICGDVFIWHKNAEYSVAVLADGIGHGIKANIYANLFATRIIKLIEFDFSLREAVEKAVISNQINIKKDFPYSAFTVGKILNNGEATFLSYQAPDAIFLSSNNIIKTNPKPVELGGLILNESIFYLDKNDDILLVTDGVTQAGTGSKEFPMGWGEKNLISFLKNLNYSKTDKNEVISKILEQCYILNNNKYGDDTTAVLIKCREGKIINILTGPSTDKEKDYEIINNFLSKDGVPVICGDTTAKIASRITGNKITMDENPSLVAPPRYYIDGFYLVTEGAVTLNQTYNIIDTVIEDFEEENSVSVLYKLLNAGDKINFFLGTASNPGHQSILFKQKGIIPRDKIVHLLAEKLKSMGKIVTLNKI
ncbi:MAG: SpoIIE family protein phosphatase [Candidatus Muiribacteriota bacterium]